MTTDARLSVLKDMILFVEVGRRKNFSEAADALGMPLSTLARRIAQLESDVGLPLVERTTRSQRLTTEGQSYFERCRHVVDDAMAAYDDLHARINGLSGRVELTISAELSGPSLSEILHRFAAQHPALSLAASVDEAAQGQGADLAIEVGSPACVTKTVRRLGILSVGLFAAPRYLAEGVAITTKSSLRGHAIIVPRSYVEFCDPSLRDVLAACGGDGRLAFHAFTPLIAAMAANGRGIAALPLATAEPFVAAGGLVRVLPGWHPIALPILAVMRDRRLPARTRALLTPRKGISLRPRRAIRRSAVDRTGIGYLGGGVRLAGRLA